MRKRVALSGLGRGDPLGPRLHGCRTVEVLVRDRGLDQVLLDQLEVAHEPVRRRAPCARPWRRSSSVVAKVLSLELGGPSGCTRRGLQHASRSLVRWANTCRRRWPDSIPSLAIARSCARASRSSHSPLPQRLVEGCLFGRHLHMQRHIGAWRKIVQDIGLDPAQHEGRDQAAETHPGGGVAVALDGQGEVLAGSAFVIPAAPIDKAEE